MQDEIIGLKYMVEQLMKALESMENKLNRLSCKYNVILDKHNDDFEDEICL